MLVFFMLLTEKGYDATASICLMFNSCLCLWLRLEFYHPMKFTGCFETSWSVPNWKQR